MFELNGPKGLGDAIYLRAIARHLIEQGETVRVYNDWPDVFRNLAVEVVPLARLGLDDRHLHSATACLHCQVPAIRLIDKFTLACLQAGITDRVPLRIDWRIQNSALLERVRRLVGGRKVLVYQTAKIVRNAVQEMWQPRRVAFDRYLAGRSDCFRIKLGHPAFTIRDDDAPCELDLFGQVSVTDSFDLVSIADLIFAEDCYLPILAQAMDKPFVCMFSRRAANSNKRRVFCVTPERNFHKPALGTALFDE